jgi:peptidoglycan/xylan/chitin deacetylase (PgdA/CDA1 family)
LPRVEALEPSLDRDLVEERYATRKRSARSLTLYYRLKPCVPRRLQIAGRRAHARNLRRRQERAGRFPRWPIEPVMVERWEADVRDRLRRTGARRIPFIGFWPHGHRFAFIVTHDVETASGLANARRVLEIERRHDIVSSWNLVAGDYPIEPLVLDAIRAAGGEIGLHGLSHDGRLFESRSRFERQLPGIHRTLGAWGADGFRSPATHRNADWMPELGCLYDSSFPDTDPFEPQPGGCCSILPFFLGDVVELPITLVQDHTLFEILGERDISLWREKAAWLARHGGLVTVLVHPDYVQSRDRLRRYEELLAFLCSLPGGWHALPRDVARWWRRRAELTAAVARGEPLDPSALAAAGASIAWARESGGEIVTELGEGS